MARIKIGDIFEISTLQGNAYLHYIHKDEKIGRQLMRVLQGLHECRPNNFDELVNAKEQYLIFFSLSAANNRKIIERVGHYRGNDFDKPKHMRSEHNVRGEFLGWHIIDTDTWKRQLVKDLSPVQKAFSDWATWNNTLLIERLVNGWSLEKWS